MFSPNFASSPSLADIAAVTDNNRGNNNGFGDNNGWWILIIRFALFGWGRGGYGNGYGNGKPSVVYVPTGGMNGLNTNIMQTGYGIQNSITQMGIAQMQDTNAISRQLADCCGSNSNCCNYG